MQLTQVAPFSNWDRNFQIIDIPSKYLRNQSHQIQAPSLNLKNTQIKLHHIQLFTPDSKWSNHAPIHQIGKIKNGSNTCIKADNNDTPQHAIHHQQGTFFVTGSYSQFRPRPDKGKGFAGGRAADQVPATATATTKVLHPFRKEEKNFQQSPSIVILLHITPSSTSRKPRVLNVWFSLPTMKNRQLYIYIYIIKNIKSNIIETKRY